MTRAGGTPELFVIDTSSIIEVRRLMSQESVPRITATYAALIQLSKRSALRFPKGVIEELSAFVPSKGGKTDPAQSWALACDADATPHSEIFAEARDVLARVPDLLDATKTSTIDEADPYVVGLALKLVQDGEMVTVITEETRDTPDKTSMRSACGVMRIPSISMRVFLARQNIWP